jgi:hypothetical protein
MSEHLQSHVSFTEDAQHSLGEDPDIQTGIIFHKEGVPVPGAGDLIQIGVNGKPKQFVVALRQFIYDSAGDVSIRYVLDIIR